MLSTSCIIHDNYYVLLLFNFEVYSFSYPVFAGKKSVPHVGHGLFCSVFCLVYTRPRSRAT